MDVVNETLLCCHISRSQLAFEDLLHALVVLKGTFDTLPDGDTELSEEQEPVLSQDSETPWGTLEAEIAPEKAWCDVAVLGAAHCPPPGNPVPRMDVSVRIGADWRRSLRITGDRTWLRPGGKSGGNAGGNAGRNARFIPSEPIPFTRLPLTYERAFGGVADEPVENMADVPLPFFDNPDGRGYVTQSARVEGTPLPNVEEPDQLVQSWQDRPLPAGLAPLSRRSFLRSRRGVEVDEETKLCRMEPSAFCFAHPRMKLQAYPAGALVEVEGMSPFGTWSFRLPELPLWARIDLGGARYLLPLVPDTIYLRPEERRLVVLARRGFVYQFVRERPRRLHLMSGPDLEAAGVPTSIREQQACAAPKVPIKAHASDVLDVPFEDLVAAHPMTALVADLPLCPSG